MHQTVELSFQHVPGPRDARRRAVFLHGILGSGQNLRAIARRFVAARPGWDAWLIDLRGHGASPKGTPMPSLAATAEDVAALCARSIPVGALIGHSFGSKVALEVARRTAGPLPSGVPQCPAPLGHVVSIDGNPGAREPTRGDDSALAVLDLLGSLPATSPSAGAFVEAVVARGQPPALARWLAKSLAPAPGGGVRFALDLDEVRELVMSYFAADLWPVVESPPEHVRVHLVIAERSTAYAPEDRERVRRIATREPRVTVDSLPTGHWVHTEDPDGLLRVLLSRIPEGEVPGEPGRRG